MLGEFSWLRELDYDELAETLDETSREHGDQHSLYNSREWTEYEAAQFERRLKFLSDLIDACHEEFRFREREQVASEKFCD